jgi:hypothetical protein
METWPPQTTDCRSRVCSDRVPLNAVKYPVFTYDRVSIGTGHRETFSYALMVNCSRHALSRIPRDARERIPMLSRRHLPEACVEA